MRNIIFFLLIAFSVRAQQQTSVNASTGTGKRAAQNYLYTVAYDSDPLNRFILIYFDGPVYSTSDDAGVKSSDLQIIFAQNGGTATDATIASVKNISNSDLVGGENTIRVNLTLSGSASGIETVTIKPATDFAIKDGYSYSIISLNNVLITLSPTYDTRYQDVLSYVLSNAGYVAPVREYRTIENQWVVDINATGEWATLDRAFRFSKYGNINYALLNWKTPGTGNLTIGLSMPWVYGNGFTVGSGYFLTGWVPSSATNCVLNDCGIFHASETDLQNNAMSEYGVRNVANTSQISINSRLTDNTSTIGLNSNAGASAAVMTTSSGTILHDRVSSLTSGHDLYLNGALVDGTNFASIALPDQEMVIEAFKGNTGTITSISSRKVSLWMGGASMGTNVAALNTAETNFVASNAAVTFLQNLKTESVLTITTNDGTTITTD